MEKDAKELGNPLIVRKQEGWKRPVRWSLMWLKDGEASTRNRKIIKKRHGTDTGA